MNTSIRKSAALFAVGILAFTPVLVLADHSMPAGSMHEEPAVAVPHEEPAVAVPIAAVCAIESNLALGSRGSAVACLQSMLVKGGFLQNSLPKGYYGAATKDAVSRWQEKNHIAATGYFGPLSRAAASSHTEASVSIEHPYYKELEESHKEMMAAFMSTSTSMAMDMPDNRKVVAVVLYDEFEPLDAVGPLEVLGQLKGYKVVTVAKKKGEVASAFGTKFVADYSFDELKNPAIVVVPGGLFGTIAASKDAATLAWIREADKTSEYTTSVCTGAWILAAAGLLSGREASTHWTGADYLEDFGVKYTGKRYTVDGKYITAAGVSAGIDMGFKLVAMIEGNDAAKVAQLGLEYDPQPPFDSGSPSKADPQLVKIMRGMMNDHLMAASMMYGTTSAMTAATTTADNHAAAMSGMGTHAHATSDVSSWSSVPTLAIELHPDTMGGWNLELKTQNLRFAPEHVGGAVVPSEGHAHLYIDGVKVARIYGNWYNIPITLFKGTGSHVVRVTLNANDHSDLSLQGTSIAAEAQITL